MDEAQWLACDDPARMLDFALGHRDHRDRERFGFPVSARKLRLWACACCRQVWDGTECQRCRGSKLVKTKWYGGAGGICPDCHGAGRVGGLTDERSRRAVEVAEKFADGLATEDEVSAAGDAANDVDELRGRWSVPEWAAAACCVRNASDVLVSVRNSCGVPPAAQATLLRHIVNPWHSVCAWRVVYDGLCRKCKGTGSGGDNFTEGGKRVTCLACRNTGHECVRRPEPWLSPSVIALAAALYDGGDCAAALCDALLEAGAPAELAEHFRPQERCRRCNGLGRIVYELSEPPHAGEKSYPCPACSGRGLTGGEWADHPKACWALDLLLGKA